jgi:hypothetical protein
MGQRQMMTGVADDFRQQIAGRRITVQDQSADQIEAAAVR